MACRYRNVACAREAAADVSALAVVQVGFAVAAAAMAAFAADAVQFDVACGLQLGAAVAGLVADVRALQADGTACVQQEQALAFRIVFWMARYVQTGLLVKYGVAVAVGCIAACAAAGGGLQLDVATGLGDEGACGPGLPAVHADGVCGGKDDLVCPDAGACMVVDVVGIDYCLFSRGQCAAEVDHVVFSRVQAQVGAADEGATAA